LFNGGICGEKLHYPWCCTENLRIVDTSKTHLKISLAPPTPVKHCEWCNLPRSQNNDIYIQYIHLNIIYIIYICIIYISPKNENSVIIYSPSRCSKPLWISFFWWGLLDFCSSFFSILWKSEGAINCLVAHILLNIFLCSAEERNSYRFGTS